MKGVVITKIGMVSGNGNNVSEIWAALSKGEARRSQISDVHFDPSKYRGCRSGDIPITTVCGSPLTNDRLAEMAGVKRVQRYDRHQLLAQLAVREVMEVAGDWGCSPHSFGIVGATGDGGLSETFAAYERLVAGKELDPFANIRQLPNPFAGRIANTYGLKGPGFVHCTACAASSHALQQAADTIMLGRALMMLVVGTEAAITQFGIASFGAQRAIANESKPYQRDRKGFLMGEGAVALLLEEYDHAVKRGANILAEIAGYAATTDGVVDGQITDPDSNGGARSAVAAMEMAGIEPRHLACISTHGTGTPVGDKAELEGIVSWAGDRAAEIPTLALKSYSGHLLGAAGAFAIANAVLMLKYDLVLPTYGLTEGNLDSTLPRVGHVMGVPRRLEGDHILVNAFGFGGTNASVIIRRPS